MIEIEFYRPIHGLAKKSMTRHSFAAIVNHGIRAAAAAQRARVREHAAQQRETDRLAREQAKIAREAHLSDQQALAVYKTEEANAHVAAIEGLLTNSLSLPLDVDLSSLRRTVQEADANTHLTVEPPPLEQEYLARPLGWFSRLFADARNKYASKQAAAQIRFVAAQSAYAQRIHDQQHAVEKRLAEVQSHNEMIDHFGVSLQGGNPDAMVTYTELLLKDIPMPEGFISLYRVALVQSSMQLVIEFEAPRLDDIVPENESYRYLRQSNQIVPKKKSAKTRASLYSIALAQLPLVLLNRLFCSSGLKPIQTIVLSGFVDTIDPSTGHKSRPCLVSIRATRDEFVSLNLDRVDPVACLKRLSATVSRSPSELLAVKPIVNFDMVDSRFVSEKDILSNLDSRPNLMELTPSEFESLITNLFQSMGLETKLTQASRDGGVDCVAFDPRPVLGGKVVVQAKRYRHTVGVSAVRDLFGTMHNEGASKGILVTTSGFGKAAYAFANGKPMELLSGENLLYLLKEHADVTAKIDFPDDWKDPSSDLAENSDSQGR